MLKDNPKAVDLIMYDIDQISKWAGLRPVEDEKEEDYQEFDSNKFPERLE